MMKHDMIKIWHEKADELQNKAQKLWLTTGTIYASILESASKCRACAERLENDRS